MFTKWYGQDHLNMTIINIFANYIDTHTTSRPTACAHLTFLIKWMFKIGADSVAAHFLRTDIPHLCDDHQADTDLHPLVRADSRTSQPELVGSGANYLIVPNTGCWPHVDAMFRYTRPMVHAALVTDLRSGVIICS